MYESLKDNIKALEQQISNQNLNKDRLATYRTYCLGLKKDVRLFEEAIDDIKYGNAGKILVKEKSSIKATDLDLIGDETGGVNTETKNSKEVKEMNLLDLDVDINALDIPIPPPQLAPIQNPAPVSVHAEAFDFLSDKPSAEDFINLIK